MATDLAAREASRLIEASNLSPEAIKSVRAQFEQAEQAVPSSRGPNDIDSLAGLEGTYIWLENLLHPSTISFSDAIDSQGHYTITSFLSNSVESGSFQYTPNNPAIGFASLLLVPANGAPSRLFKFLNIIVDSAGLIRLALLQRVGRNGRPVGLPFPATRIL